MVFRVGLSNFLTPPCTQYNNKRRHNNIIRVRRYARIEFSEQFFIPPRVVHIQAVQLAESYEE